MEAELDLSGRSPRGDMLKSGLEGEREARIVTVDSFKQKEDLKMYSRSPDYDILQGYDLGLVRF